MALSFHELQSQLQPGWGCEHSGEGGPFDVLVVPSLSMDGALMALVTGAHHYEERQLFSLIRLRDPGVRAIYVTSKLLPELVVDAVLELLPGELVVKPLGPHQLKGWPEPLEVLALLGLGPEAPVTDETKPGPWLRRAGQGPSQ